LKPIELFKDGKEPARPYSVIRTLTDDARLEEEPAIESDMIKKARKLGGDALIFDPMTETGYDIAPFMWGAKKSFLYRAKVIKYN
jgi:hypothetical protein